MSKFEEKILKRHDECPYIEIDKHIDKSINISQKHICPQKICPKFSLIDSYMAILSHIQLYLV